MPHAPSRRRPQRTAAPRWPAPPTPGAHRTRTTAPARAWQGWTTSPAPAARSHPRPEHPHEPVAPLLAGKCLLGDGRSIDHAIGRHRLAEAGHHLVSHGWVLVEIVHDLVCREYGRSQALERVEGRRLPGPEPAG